MVYGLPVTGFSALIYGAVAAGVSLFGLLMWIGGKCRSNRKSK